MSKLHSWSPRGQSPLEKRPQEGPGGEGRKCPGAGAGGARAGLSGPGGCSAAAGLRAARGGIPGREAGRRVLASSRRREEAIPDFPVSGRGAGEGPLASGPAIWRALLGSRAPAAQAASSLPQAGCGAGAPRGDGRAKAGPGPVAPPRLPGAWAALTHIPAPPAGRQLPWPRRFSLAARFPRNSPGFPGSPLVGRQLPPPLWLQALLPPPWPACVSPASPRALRACAP